MVQQIYLLALCEGGKDPDTHNAQVGQREIGAQYCEICQF